MTSGMMKNDRSLLQNIVSCLGFFAKETYVFREPTNRSNLIRDGVAMMRRLLKNTGLFCRISSVF